ncbi:hypothetical protein B0H14DRAFT_2524778 [Mycena olivaceomarginata]|nr:hypothetical protein B0H14DRAFT_2524778 [Mycena olivaceomarginata]
MSSPTTENNAPRPPVFIPASPFANAAGVDAILRSSDGADFYVHRAILAFVSPVFRDMFTLPQPATEPEIPVISVQENSSVLDRALRFFYPGEQPAIGTLDELGEVIEVLISKYDVQCVIPAAKQHLTKYMADQPLGVYAVALTYDWRDVAKEAAKHSLNLPLRSRLANKAPPGLDQITGAAYHNLLRYHYLCSTVASKPFQTLSWVAGGSSPDYWFCCNRCGDESLRWTFSDDVPRHIPAWFREYLKHMPDVLASRPGAHLIDNNLVFQSALSKAHCNTCDLKWFSVFYFITKELRDRINAEMDKVRPIWCHIPFHHSMD